MAAKKKASKPRRKRSPAKPKVQIVRVSNGGGRAKTKRPHRRRRKHNTAMNLGNVGTALGAAALGIASGWLLTKAHEMVESNSAHYGVAVGGTALGAIVSSYSPLYGSAVMTPAVASLGSLLLESGKKTVGEGIRESLLNPGEKQNKGLGAYDYDPVYMPSEVSSPYRLDAVEASIGAVAADVGGWEQVESVSDGFMGEIEDRQAMLRDAFY